MTNENLPETDRQAAKKAAVWQQISNLLREYELAQIESTKQTIAASYDSLRQKLQVVALEDDMAETDDGG
jgi:hypothetical protein